MFTKYSSIDNLRSKIVGFLQRTELIDMPWEVSEKIHGANFGVHIDKENQITFSRRSAILEEGENFFNYQKLAPELEKCILQLKKIIPFSLTSEVSVYGELFGGGFYKDQVQGAKRVQSGVEYHPDIKFMAFDVKVNDKFLTARDSYLALTKAGFDKAPVIKICKNFDEVLQMNPNFKSMVPQYYGLTCEEDNLAEGYVIKPALHEGVLGNGKRIILKNKREGFSERKGKKHTPRVIVTMSDNDSKVYQEVSRYINDNRLNNVLSKEGTLQGKDFPRVVGLLLQDALEDFEKDNAPFKGLVENNDLVKRELQYLTSNLVRKDWINIISEV